MCVLIQGTHHERIRAGNEPKAAEDSRVEMIARRLPRADRGVANAIAQRPLRVRIDRNASQGTVDTLRALRAVCTA